MIIYLIESSGLKGDGFFKLFKIGYTKKDVGLDSIISQHKYYNPSCKLMYAILGADMNDLNRIYDRFKSRNIKQFGGEWFEYSKEIIDYFKIPRSVIKDVYSRFTVGNKYTISYINDELQDIYSKNGYNKKPHATDLSIYFNIKKTTDNKFEIL